MRFVLKLAHVGSGRAFLPLLNYKFNAVTFHQAPESFSNNGRVMHEDILSPIAADEAVAFLVAEPLYGSGQTFTHFLKISFPYEGI
jgi:hypothetical protein